MTSSSNQSSVIIGTASVTWTVDNFANTNNLTWSPVFHPSNIQNVEFQVGIYPNSTVTFCEEDVFVYLYNDNDQIENRTNLEYDVTILKSNGEKGFTKKFYWNYDQNNDHYRNATYFTSNTRLNDEFVQNDKLTLRCDVKLHASPISPNNHSNPQTTEADNAAALKDYESLLESGKLSDTVLLEDGKKEFHVHKLILSARSPVFAAMFEHRETKEAQEGRVTLTDVSVEVCEQLLRYIYSGKIEQLNVFALDLFVVADKYQLKHLKSICEQSLNANITSESVSNVLTFADMHSAQELKQKCIDYITENSVEVRKSVSWKQLCRSKPELLIDLYADMSDKAKF